MSSIRHHYTFIRFRPDYLSIFLPDIIQQGEPISFHESVGIAFDLDSEFLFGD